MVKEHDRIRDEWQAVARGWRRWEPLFQSFTWPVALRMAAVAQIGAGQRVLDVGCGIGDPTLQVAVLVGPHGRVLGIDLVEDMLATARERAAALGLGHVEFRAADVATLEVPPASFDAVLARWSLIYVDDVAGALARLRCTLQAGGRIAVTAWAPPEDNPWIAIPMEGLARVLPLSPPDPAVPQRRAAARAALAVRARRDRVLGDAGGHGGAARPARRRPRRTGAPGGAPHGGGPDRAVPQRRRLPHPRSGAARLGRTVAGSGQLAEPFAIGVGAPSALAEAFDERGEALAVPEKVPRIRQHGLDRRGRALERRDDHGRLGVRADHVPRRLELDEHVVVGVEGRACRQPSHGVRPEGEARQQVLGTLEADPRVLGPHSRVCPAPLECPEVDADGAAGRCRGWPGSSRGESGRPGPTGRTAPRGEGARPPAGRSPA
ncbi:MAG: methyltransferase domain-containing protein [Deltaproteobacteria bacterium]|nr:MAG: methyltransferase domain-containing protein [Deltaproteobacteria bacterium]